MGAYLSFVEELNLNITKPLCVSHRLWPVHVALNSSETPALHQVGEHHHHPDVVLPDHAPEGRSCVLAGTLRNKETLDPVYNIDSVSYSVQKSPELQYIS